MTREAAISGAANANAAQSQLEPRTPRTWQTGLLGAYLILLFLALSYVLLKLWIKRENGDEISLFWNLFHRQLQEDSRLLAIAMVSGALGGFFHAVKSFTAFVGNRRMYVDWFWWYITRPLSGMALATAFYFVARAGLVAGQDPDKVSVYGVAAMAVVAGMFSDQAALKLKELFSVLFRTADSRADRLDDSGWETTLQKPVIKSLSKEEVKSGVDTELTLTGTGFVQQSIVTLAGKAIKPTFVSSSELKLSLHASDLPPVGSHGLRVVNPAPAGPSDPVELMVA